MDLVIVRHAIAEERETFARTGQDDALRPLTAPGRRKMERAAAGIARVAPEVDALASSPLVRARDTAAILAPALGLRRVEEVEALAPDAEPEALLPWLRAQARRRAVAVVGHEPHLGLLVALLLAGRNEPFAILRKGGACLVRLPRRPGPATGELRWLLEPSQLRALGR